MGVVSRQNMSSNRKKMVGSSWNEDVISACDVIASFMK